MPESTRRKRFPLFPIRWHLSTAIVLMFVAGGLIWANTRKWWTETESVWSGSFNSGPLIRGPYYGWPRRLYDNDSTTRAVNRLQGLNYFEDDGPSTKEIRSHWIMSGVWINSAVALAILLAVWLLCEWLIRRRTAQKEP